VNGTRPNKSLQRAAAVRLACWGTTVQRAAAVRLASWGTTVQQAAAAAELGRNLLKDHRQEWRLLTAIGGGATSVELAHDVVGDRRQSKSLLNTLSFMGFRSEHQLQGELNLPGGVHGAEDSSCAGHGAAPGKDDIPVASLPIGVWGVCRRSEVGVVRDIKKLSAELHIQPLVNAGVFQN